MIAAAERLPYGDLVVRDIRVLGSDVLGAAARDKDSSEVRAVFQKLQTIHKATSKLAELLAALSPPEAVPGPSLPLVSVVAAPATPLTLAVPVAAQVAAPRTQVCEQPLTDASSRSQKFWAEVYAIGKFYITWGLTVLDWTGWLAGQIAWKLPCVALLIGIALVLALWDAANEDPFILVQASATAAMTVPTALARVARVWAAHMGFRFAQPAAVQAPSILFVPYNATHSIAKPALPKPYSTDPLSYFLALALPCIGLGWVGVYVGSPAA